MSNVSVIINGYRRPDNLNEQLEALNNQTLKPSEILFWYNNPGDEYDINYDIGTKIPGVYANYNFGVWGRFAFALLAKSEYVCIFDDDTIPGKKWLENCLTTINAHNGLLGTVGVLYLNPLPPENSSYYEHYIRFGWPEQCNNEKTVEVDLVGHSWFFKKEWLSYMWREQPNPKYNTCGEDMHFSYMLQKYAGIKTYTPPHPIDDKEMWGSTKGEIYGGDKVSLWESNQLGLDGTPFKNLMNEYFRNQRINGWKLFYER